MEKQDQYNFYMDLTDNALLEEVKKQKTATKYDSFIFGLLIGIAIYSVIRNGFGLLMFLPLLYFLVSAKNKKKNRALQEVLIERNLEDDI